jgi:hypothetical protein
MLNSTVPTDCTETAHQHAHAQGEQYQRALGLTADLLGRFVVHVNLPGDEEEVIADAMQEDARRHHPEDGTRSRQRKQHIA